MGSPRDPFDWLRGKAEYSPPTSEQRQEARDKLQELIDAERKATAASQHMKRRYLLVGVAAVLAGVVLLPLALTDSAQASLAEVARAARQASLGDIPEGGFAYTLANDVSLIVLEGSELSLEQDSVAYLLPVSRETWWRPSERFLAIRSEVGIPTFFDSKSEDAYYRTGHDEIDRVGEVVVEQLVDVASPTGDTTWPKDPVELRAAIEEALIRSDSEGPSDGQVFDFTMDLLRESTPNPELRSAILEVLATLPLELIEETSATLTVGLAENGQLMRVTLSRRGELLAEQTVLTDEDPDLGLAEGTIVSQTEYLERRTVESLPRDLSRD